MYRLSTVICQVLEFSILSCQSDWVTRKDFVASICIRRDATCFDILRVCVCVCVRSDECDSSVKGHSCIFLHTLFCQPTGDQCKRTNLLSSLNIVWGTRFLPEGFFFFFFIIIIHLKRNGSLKLFMGLTLLLNMFLYLYFKSPVMFKV